MARVAPRAECDLATGQVRQVSARGSAEVVAFEPERARRKLVRYLGGDEDTWDARFRVDYLHEPEQATRLVRMVPDRMSASDFSFSPGS